MHAAFLEYLFPHSGDMFYSELSTSEWLVLRSGASKWDLTSEPPLALMPSAFSQQYRKSGPTLTPNSEHLLLMASRGEGVLKPPFLAIYIND